MKNLKILIALLSMVAFITACSSQGTGTDQDELNETSQTNLSSTGEPNPNELPEGEFNFEIPLQTVLIIGTFELEATENEVTPEQAGELLPLWIVLKNLLESETAAVAEIDALTNQINEAMTDAQIAFINSLDMSPQSTRDLMAELGLAEDFPRPENADGETTGEFQRPEGAGMGPGMGPGGGGGAGLDVSPEEMESFQATREAGGGRMGNRQGFMGNTILIEALIELLENK